MIKVTWTIQEWVNTGCPDYKPDPYTGEYPSFHCAVIHGEYRTKEMVKKFDTLLEASLFINNAPKHIKSKMVITEC